MQVVRHTSFLCRPYERGTLSRTIIITTNTETTTASGGAATAWRGAALTTCSIPHAISPALEPILFFLCCISYLLYILFGEWKLFFVKEFIGTSFPWRESTENILTIH